DGMGGWGITYDDIATGNPPQISKAFYAEFPGDRFDELTVFTGFVDSSSIAASALEWSVRNKVAGVGLGAYDSGKLFGSPARLKTWVNMRNTGPLLADPASWVWATWAQEVGHLDLAHLLFTDRGMASPEMLGRDKAHWSRLLQAFGSVMDGNF